MVTAGRNPLFTDHQSPFTTRTPGPAPVRSRHSWVTRLPVVPASIRLLGNSDQAARENIGKRFRRHHSTGKRVNAAGAGRRFVNGLAVQDKGRDILHQLQTWPSPARLIGPAIVHLRHFRAESADVDRKV